MGGGKKKRGNPRKPRFEYVIATTAGGVDEISLTYDATTGSVGFSQKMKLLRSEEAYRREKNDKVVRSHPSSDQVTRFLSSSDPRSYDAVIAVDTNTQTHLDKEVSVTGICVATWRTEIAHWHYRCPFVVEFANSSLDKEQTGWRLALEALEAKGVVVASRRFLMVVDCHLGILPSIQNRSVPLCGDYYLPTNMDICYASADASSKSITSKVIRMADIYSSLTIKHLVSNARALAFSADSSSFAQRICIPSNS